MNEQALEAAARALCEMASGSSVPDIQGDDGTPAWTLWLPDAKRAIAAYREASEEARDAARLHFWFWEGVDGFKGLPMDKYEYACEVAARNGREEPNEDDELQGFREFTDAAMAVFAQEGK